MWDKEGINAVLKEFDGQPGSISGPSTGSAVLLISLEKQAFFDEMYEQVMVSLRSKATVVEATEITSAMHRLSKANEDYAAVIVTDPAVMVNNFIAAQKKIVNYVQNGGTVVMGFFFSNFARLDKLGLFFQKRWNLGWKAGAYTRSMFSLNPQVNRHFTARQLPSLPNEYSMKALHLRDTKLEDRVYVGDSGETDSPAVFSKYGSGYLG